MGSSDERRSDNVELRNQHRLAAAADRHVRCKGTLGSRPGWMSPDQYDASGGPCECLLFEGHDGPHECSHTRSEEANDG